MASQTQLGFQSALIVEATARPRLRGLPWRGVHIFSTAHFNNRLSDTIECSQPLPKNFNQKFWTFKNIIKRLNGVQDAANRWSV